MMQVFLGSTRDGDYLRRMGRLGWGRLFAAENPKPSASEKWALDNGVFAAWKSGNDWNEQPFLGALFAAERKIGVGLIRAPEMVVLPDIVADPKSLAFSLAWLDRHPWWGHPWYLVLQNGMKHDEIRRVLRERKEIAGLFLGGDDDFKLTARAWCDLAHEEGRKFHFARVSTIPRLRAAHDMKADSCDTTQPLWSEALFDRFERAWRELEAGSSQVEMFR